MTSADPTHGHNEPGYFDRIAHSYDSHRSPLGPHVARLHALVAEAKAERMLEIGPGTGNSALVFREGFDGTLFGLDRSLGMLRENAQKHIAMQRVNGSATQIPFASNSFQFIFAVLAIHHVRELGALMSECFRVLDTGACAFATAPRQFIDTYPLNDYFPSFAPIDRERFQHEDDVADGFSNAGFNNVEKVFFKRTPEPIDAQYVEKVENQFISTYALLPEEEFRDGLARLKADVARDGQLSTPMVWESVVISGWKR
ncbi:MAG: class I SAM-dependent methyltransferase [Candidatus Hydrogenedentota bacterium]